MVLRTTFSTASGTLRLTDALPFVPGARGHEIGLRVPSSIARVVEALDGEPEVELEFAPRPDYARRAPRMVATDGGVRALAGSDWLHLHGDRALVVDRDVARAGFTLRAGDRASFVLRHSRGLRVAQQLDGRAVIADTIEAWRSWAADHAYAGAYREMVSRSALVLQALTYQPTGAIVAAPTTSLPEVVGGDWNWDYRYSWLRDAALTLRALWVAACPDEAARYFDWMAEAAAGETHEDHLQIMYAVDGERGLEEQRLDHLRGYRDSRPVRVGNAAFRQRQLDVYGEVLDAAHLLRDRLGTLKSETASYLRDLADRAARSWRRPDSGLWEGREGERHYVSSKLMCWVALDRACELADVLHPGDLSGWRSEREKVRRAILREGWNERAGAFTGAFDSDHLDASVLLMPLMRFLPADHPRMRSTIDVIERELGEDGLLRRWTGADDGVFVICSFWLANCLARAGELERAREVFDRVTGHANDLGLLAEEIDAGGELIGNFPQAFSHVGLINAAWSIEQANDDGRDRA